MFLGQGILLALLHREHTGEGQWVHTSLLEGMLNKLDFQGARYTVDGVVPGREGNAHPTQVPMGTYQASDGLVNIAASTAKNWVSLCKVLQADDLLAHPDYPDVKSRVAHRRQLEVDMNALTARFTVAELVARLNPVGVPCGPVYDIGQAFEDPQVKHLRMTRPAAHPVMGSIDLLRSPINLSACPHPDAFACAAPDPGQDTDALLRDLGFEPAAIETMKAEGAVV